MADSHEDILAKANQLLRRHASPKPDAADARDVPVLTDLVGHGQAAAADPAGTEPEANLAAELTAEVMRAVEERLAEELERRLTEHLAAELQSSIAATLAGLRREIAGAVGEAVAQALARRNRP